MDIKEVLTKRIIRNRPESGQKWGRLMFTGKFGLSKPGINNTRQRVTCECLCDCGVIVWPMLQSLKSSRTVSCGCSRKTAIKLNCYSCGKFFERIPSQIEAHNASTIYCSLGCRKKAQGPVERFWSFVNKTDDCWLWTGANSAGYGALAVPKGMERRAPRFSWVLHNGPIPDGLDVLHKCDNPPCVRPDHLFLGTASDNGKDMAAKGRDGALTHPEKISRGESRPAAKLTENTVKEIREKYANGITIQTLADYYGVTRVLIYGVIKRQGWKHVI